MTNSRALRRIALTLGITIAVAYGCVKVPYTNRSQLVMLSQADETKLGVAAYEEVLKNEKIVTDPAINAIVRRVGLRIAAVADKPDFQWEFKVIDNPKQVNAFALPGGKVAVYTGLFPVARDEAGLAVVMGHEVAHALARHGAERVSQGMMAQIVGVGLSMAVAGNNPATRNAVMQAYGLGAQVGVLMPFGRSQESEADHIGMILMAKAGYDPTNALTLWQRMEASGSGKSPPEWLSTHPGYGTRQNNISGWMAEAQGYYKAAAHESNVTLPKISGAAAPKASAQ